MKIQYVNANTHNVLASLDVDKDITEEQIKTVGTFDKEEIVSLTIEFNAGVLTEQTHDMGNVKPTMVSKMTITINKK